jgi:hypothetical protein
MAYNTPLNMLISNVIKVGVLSDTIISYCITVANEEAKWVEMAELNSSFRWSDKSHLFQMHGTCINTDPGSNIIFYKSPFITIRITDLDTIRVWKHWQNEYKQHDFYDNVQFYPAMLFQENGGENTIDVTFDVTENAMKESLLNKRLTIVFSLANILKCDYKSFYVIWKCVRIHLKDKSIDL